MVSVGHHTGAGFFTTHQHKVSHSSILLLTSLKPFPFTPRVQPTLQCSATKTFPLERRRIPFQTNSGFLRRWGFSEERSPETWWTSATRLHTRPTVLVSRRPWILAVFQGATGLLSSLVYICLNRLNSKSG